MYVCAEASLSFGACTQLRCLSPDAQVCAGFNHTLFLGENGKVYACGRNHLGALGLDNGYADEGLYALGLLCMRRFGPRLLRIGTFPAVAGRDSRFSAAPSLADSDVPALVALPNSERIVQIAAGNHHSLALTGM